MSLVIILDCGATNVRAIAVDRQGAIVASHYIANETILNGTQHVWDYQQIWHKLVECCHKVTAQINARDIVAVSVTTFGVDGAPFDKNGQQIYPIISWKCSRTAAVIEQVAFELDRSALYQANGVGDYSFNTLFKLKWLKDNEPDIYQRMDKWVFISSMITHQLTGRWTTDRTMAGTSMMTDLDTKDWHLPTLDYLGLSQDHFPPMIDAGDIVGWIDQEAASLLGVPEHTPVVSAGHDTQFALFGSGVLENQPFLSSGTWEILMARAPRPTLRAEYLRQGLTTELDAKNGLYNPAIQWLSSAVMEWVCNTLFSDIQRDESKYEVMIAEGSAAPVGCNGTRFVPDFLLDAENRGKGQLSGLSINTTRGEIYRAALEGLAFQLADSLSTLADISQFEADGLMVVGGGSKNVLWNQIRADVLGIPMCIVDQPESTVIGAAMYAFTGAGIYRDAEQAQQAMKPSFTVVRPTEQQALYQPILQERRYA
nr:L-fuculokinase [uncultured Vibrio sp.]